MPNYFQPNYDKKDLPQPFTISSLSSFRVKLTAIESWNFVRLFPLMFGKKVPIANEHWEFLGLVLDFIKLVTCLKFTESLTYYIDEMYAQVLEDFVRLFPDIKVKPKMHYGVHYGGQTREYGPPRTRFTLRFESKNHAIKEPITRYKNRVNVCKTIAYRHQYRIYLRYIKQYFFNSGYECVGARVDHSRALEINIQNLIQPIINKEIVPSRTGVHHPNGSYFVNEMDILTVKKDNYVFYK